MAKLVLDDVASGYNRSKINSNFQKIEDELTNKVVYKDEPNVMSVDIDLNDHYLLNVKDAIRGKDAVNLSQLNALINGVAQGALAVKVHSRITATAGQTLVSLTDWSYVPSANNLSVYLNGVRQRAVADYDETSPTSITFLSPLLEGDEIDMLQNEAVTSIDVVQEATLVASADTVDAATTVGEAGVVDVATDVNTATTVASAGTISNVTSTPNVDSATNVVSATTADTVGTANTVTNASWVQDAADVFTANLVSNTPYVNEATEVGSATTISAVISTPSVTTATTVNSASTVTTATTVSNTTTVTTASTVTNATNVTTATNVANLVITRSSRVTATAGQTVVGTSTYVQGNQTLAVYLNGVRQFTPEDYSETSTTSITFTSALLAGDVVDSFVHSFV